MDYSCSPPPMDDNLNNLASNGESTSIWDRDKNRTSTQNMDKSKPPARRLDALAGPTQQIEDQHMILSTSQPTATAPPRFSHTTTHAFEENGASKIEAPTSKNIEPYLSSLAPAPELLDRTFSLPSGVNANNIQQSSARGRQRHRNNTAVGDFPSSGGFDVPLRFVHVPNHTKNNAHRALERAPSVPDLISYSHHHQYEEQCSIPLLSDEALRDKEFGIKEQLEERLRRAHLRLNSDALVSSVARYRSKSTPSRSGMWVNESQSESGKVTSVASNRQTSGHAPTLVHANLRQFETTSSRESPAIPVHDSGYGVAPPPALVASNQGDRIINSNTADSGGALDVHSSEESSDGSSRRVGTLSGIFLEEGRGSAILKPPPPPPPATEKERLVERERQARLETERARRRHLALQRERQLEDEDHSLDHESGGVVENESSDNVGLLGHVSFDGGSQPAPEYVGDSALVMEMLTEHSSVDSLMASIPRPPLPPPPATEKERLVERERQARLETERARRRHLALQRERQLVDEDNSSVDDHDDTIPHARGLNYGNNSLLPEDSLDHGVLATSLPHTTEGDNDNTNIEQNTDTAEGNSLSYPMERFLERVDDEGPSIILPIIDLSATENNDAELPYTMELFLAENAVPNDNSSDNERSIIESNGIDVGQIHQTNNDGHIEPLIATPAIQLILASDTNLNEMPLAEVGEGGDVRSHLSSGSVTSIVESNRGTLDDNEIDQSALTDNHVSRRNNGHSWANTDSSPSRISIAPSSHDESFDISPRLSRLTEADIANFAEVEHASTGNAAPQSVRDEPSEASIVGRGAFLDHAFSVATQTTVIESVTEASVGRGESAVRVGSGRSIQTSTTTSRGAGSASIEAMPSSDSSDDSDDIHPPPSEGTSDSHYMAPSFSDEIPMPLLTEADIVTMADIDQASVGNAPPRSVRDERLSESSVTERGGRQFGITAPITEISRVDGPCSLSDNSIEVMPSEHGGDVSDEEMIVYQNSDMGSSASVEALPSIDLENEIILHNYGAINAEDVRHNSLAEGLAMDVDDREHDIETAPLISNSHHGNFSENRDLIGKLRAYIYIAFGIGLGIGFGIALGIYFIYCFIID